MQLAVLPLSNGTTKYMISIPGHHVIMCYSNIEIIKVIDSLNNGHKDNGLSKWKKPFFQTIVLSKI